MRSTRHAAAACALGFALLVPAIPLAAQEAEQPAPEAEPPTLTPSNVRPDAALSSAQSDGTVSFDASASIDSDGSIVAYAWDLDGDSVYETDTGGEPRVEHTYDPGTTLIAAVRVTDDAGASDDATAAVVVAAAVEEPAAAEPPAPAPAEAAPLVPTGDLPAEPRPAPRAVKASREAKAEEPADEKDPPATAAASKSVAITDFEFGPATVNVNVGDTVTWNNRGPTNHTATADNGSFDSGNLNRGQSYSRTFSSAGTFTYFCEPHPFMKGRVVVAGSGGGSGSSGGSSGGSGSGSGSGDADSGDTAGAGSGSDGGSGGGSLASTGADLVPWSLFGFSLLVFGAALRYRLTE